MEFLIENDYDDDNDDSFNSISPLSVINNNI